MAKKTKTKTKTAGNVTTVEFESAEEALEVINSANDALQKELDEMSEHENEVIDSLADAIIESANESADALPTEKELTQDEQIAAYIRKEQILRDAQTELNTLENQRADARREVNSYKEPIADARAKVARLISCDVSGFLRWEKEQELPLIQKAEEAANAWRHVSVSQLDITVKEREKLFAHDFLLCGQVADWLGRDFPDKKTGLNGEKTKERLRDAINKISGNVS
jgi:hypothetical protein